MTWRDAAIKAKQLDLPIGTVTKVLLMLSASICSCLLPLMGWPVRGWPLRTSPSTVNAQRSQALAPRGAHSGSMGVRRGAASSDVTGQRGSVRVHRGNMPSLFGISGQRSHKQEHTVRNLTHDQGGCDENKPDKSR